MQFLKLINQQITVQEYCFWLCSHISDWVTKEVESVCLKRGECGLVTGVAEHSSYEILAFLHY